MSKYGSSSLIFALLFGLWSVYKSKISFSRYVGKNYSNAQEAMEESMRSFYSQSFSCHTLPTPVVGQLVAIRDGDEFARAQVIEIMSPKEVKVT